MRSGTPSASPRTAHSSCESASGSAVPDMRRGRPRCVSTPTASAAVEPARVALTRSLKRGGKVWIRVFPDKPVTKKPAETRMGKGKGNPEEWVAVVKPGRILYEMEGVNEETAREAFRTAANKIGITTKFVTRTRTL